MNETFRTKEEAEARRDEVNCLTHGAGGTIVNRKFNPYFCPLINGECRTNCVCWKPARISTYKPHVTESEPYAVVDFCCGNAMFFEHEITPG
jgi:hypothetical protein